MTPASTATSALFTLMVVLGACSGGTDPVPAPCTSDASCGPQMRCADGTCVAVAPPENRPPTSAADSYEAREDETLSVGATDGVLANDVDADGDALSATLESAPASGELTLAADGSFTYRPAADAHGAVTFTYRSRDASDSSAPAVVTLTVAPVPDAPVALGDSYVAVAGEPLAVAAALGVLANDRDADGDALTAAVAVPPAHGELSLAEDGGFTYTPAGGFAGTDRFTYVARDGTSTSQAAEVEVEVAQAPVAPVAAADAYEVGEDGALDVTAAAGVLSNDADANGDALSAALVASPAGTLALAADGSFHYRPPADFAGVDTFTYRASDGALRSAITTVSVTVAPVNDAPVAAPDAYEAVRDRVLTVAAASGVLANDADVDGDALAARAVTAPAHGTASLAQDGALTYLPVAGYVGADAFTYRASDGVLESPDQTVSITVTAPPSRPPAAAADAFTTAQAQILEVAAPGVLANDSDPDGDALAAELVTAPAHGTLRLSSAGSFRYAPAPTFVGTDSFTYQATDPGRLASEQTVVTIQVTDRNLAPVALPDAFATQPGVAVAGTLRGDDPDGDALAFEVLTAPAHGSLTLDAATGAFTYAPAAGWEGGDTLAFRVSDGALTSPPADVGFDVAAAHPRWTAHGGPSPRGRHTAVWTGKEVIVWGGTDEVATLDSGARFDPAAGAWARTSRHGAPSARWRHTAVWTGSEMIVWGGERDGVRVQEPGARYDPETDTWKPVSTVGQPSFRSSHTSIWTGKEMIVCGGTNGSQIQSASYRYDPATDVWKAISSVGSACARRAHAAVWTGTEMLVWGGNVSGGGRYDPVTDTWKPMSTLGAPPARQGFAAVWTGSELVVWGGENVSTTEALGDGARYDPATDTWTALPSAGAPSPRWSAAAVWTGAQVLVWGGGSSADVAYADGAAFDPGTGAWTAIGATGAPAARIFHSGTWTGSEMIVHGGISFPSSVRRFASGGRYGAASGTWTATPESGAPTPRTQHSAVWTGSRLLVWGGESGGKVATGAAWDPDAGTWTPLPTAGAPAARAGHCAAWTGDRMLVWGSSAVATARSGAVLDPVAGTWRAMATAGAPNVLDGSCVWTGSELIVWGGADASSATSPRPPVGTGARYDPATNAWTPVTTAGAPTPRFSHSAVWTGTEMIVWGGNGPLDLLATGAAYDPALDRWRPLAPAPSLGAARTQHLAVWTGTEMIVWGGTSNTGPLQTGYVFDPATDAWTALSTAGAPTARVPVHGAWTGRALVVWGDNAVYGRGDRGGVYDPESDTWVPTATSGAPPPMSEHALVWTGQLLVFGGPGNEVWTYDP